MIGQALIGVNQNQAGMFARRGWTSEIAEHRTGLTGVLDIVPENCRITRVNLGRRAVLHETSDH
jgi:hypothetical protein